MNAKTLFEHFPELQECWLAGSSEAFAEEEEAKNYANHFNVSMKKILRTEVQGLKEPEKKKEQKKVKKVEPKGNDGSNNDNPEDKPVDSNNDNPDSKPEDSE